MEDFMSDAYEHVRKYPLNVVLAALGFETFKYRKAGTEGYGRCPVCQPKRNATAFSFDDEGKFHCFSCGAKGKGAIDLKMAVSKCGFQEAVSFLTDLPQSRPTPKEQGQERQSKAESVVTKNPAYKGTYEKYAVKSEWLEKRGLTDETCKLYEVFEYNNPARRSAYSGSVMLKMRRYSDGECVGYLSRNIGEVTQERPKYVLPKGLHKHLELFGAWQIKNEVKQLPVRICYLVESPFAVLRFHQLGFHAVSPFGWSVSPEQANILHELARGLVYLPDRNKRNESLAIAGELSRRLWLKTPDLPAGVDDPENLTAEHIRSLTGA